MPKMADRCPLFLVLLLSIGVFTLTNAGDGPSSLGQTVAFYAGNSDVTVIIAQYKTIALDTAYTNVGNGYDNTTGVFTAPVSGLYDFQAMFMRKDWRGKAIYVSIKVDGHAVARGVADNRGGSWDLTSIRAIVHVTSGQKVTLNSAATAVDNFISGSYTRFSGLLIMAD